MWFLMERLVPAAAVVSKEVFLNATLEHAKTLLRQRYVKDYFPRNEINAPYAADAISRTAVIARAAAMASA